MSRTYDQKIASAACDLEPLSRKLAQFLQYEQAQSRRPQGWCRVTEVVVQPFMQQRSEEELVKVIRENRNEDNHLRFEMGEYEQELWVRARWARWGPWEIPFKPPPRRRPTPPQVRPAPKPASTAPTPPPPPQQHVLEHATSSLERGWVYMTQWPKESSGIWLDADDSNIFFYVDESEMWATYLDPTKDMRKYWWNSITKEWFYVSGGPSDRSIQGQEER